MFRRIGKYALVLILLTAPSSTFARTWQVLPDGSGDAPTIQAGIDSASAGDTVLVGCGTYQEFDIVMKGGIVLRGEAGDPVCAVIDANEDGRVMICDSLAGETRIEGLTMMWGVNPGSGEDRNGAGLYIRHSSPIVSDCVFDNNFTSWVNGGGLYCTGSSAPLVVDCRFTNNTAGNSGGGMYAADSSLAVVRNCEFEENFASWWGGGLVCGWYSDITVDSCLFRGNTTNHYAAAFAATNRSLPTVSNCLFLENHAEYQGGAVAGYKNSIPVFENCTFYENSSGTASVVLARDTSRVYLDRCILSSNQGGQAADTWGFWSGIFFSCSDIFGNPGGDWVDAVAGQDSINGNLWVNPGFCGAGQGDFTLASNSPCFTAACGPMGALGEGCAESPPDLWYIKPDGTGTVPTILDALQQADHGDTLLLADGLFEGPGNRDLDCEGKNLTIFSESGDPLSCVIDLGGSAAEPHSGFRFDSETHRVGSLRGVTIRNGYATDVTPSARGGALFGDEYDLTVENCVFEGNYANSGGGGAYISGLPLVMTDCRFSGNTAGSGSALTCRRYAEITECEFVGNGSPSSGHALHLSGTQSSVTRCRIEGNEGGGVLVGGGLEVLLEECEIKDNWNAGEGGGACVEYFLEWFNVPCIFRKCLFSGNEADTGGGFAGRFYFYDDVNPGMETAILDSCTFVENTGNQGAAIFCEAEYTWIEIQNSIIAFNDSSEAVQAGFYGSNPSTWIQCTDIFGNPEGDWTGNLAGLLGVDGNISEDPLFCDPESGDYSLDASSPCLADPVCGVIGAFGEGCDASTDVAGGAPGFPARPFLSKNVPNPFNPVTTVRFGLPKPSEVNLAVHDIAGRRVATIVAGPYRAGEFTAAWDGLDDAGHAAGSGVYFIRMEAGDFIATRKTLLLR